MPGFLAHYLLAPEVQEGGNGGGHMPESYRHVMSLLVKSGSDMVDELAFYKNCMIFVNASMSKAIAFKFCIRSDISAPA